MLTNSMCDDDISLSGQQERSRGKFLEKFFSFFCGLLLFLGSIGYQSAIFLSIFGLCVLFRNKNTIGMVNSKGTNLLSGILILTVASVMNNMIGIISGEAQVNGAQDYIPYLLLVAFTVYFVRFIDAEIWNWFILFVLAEVVIAYFLKHVGVQNVWGVGIAAGYDDLLYNQKVSGLSLNSSGFAYKVLNVIIIYEFLKMHSSFRSLPPRYIVYPLILLGLFLSFNRTSMVCFCLFEFILIAARFRKISMKYRFLLMMVAVAATVWFSQNYDSIMYEFFRGSIDFSGNALSERPEVFAFYLDHIMNNPLTGNYSFKLWKEIFYDGRLFHPHNSYLFVLAAHGIILAMIFFLLILCYINKKNLLFLLPFFAAGMMQTYIFWGLSVNDIAFYYLLLYNFDSVLQSKEEDSTGDVCTL